MSRREKTMRRKESFILIDCYSSSRGVCRVLDRARANEFMNWRALARFFVSVAVMLEHKLHLNHSIGANWNGGEKRWFEYKWVFYGNMPIPGGFTASHFGLGTLFFCIWHVWYRRRAGGTHRYGSSYGPVVEYVVLGGGCALIRTKCDICSCSFANRKYS